MQMFIFNNDLLGEKRKKQEPQSAQREAAMRAYLVFACAVATAQSQTAFDYSSFEKQGNASSASSSTSDSSGSQNAGAAGDWQKYAGAHANWTNYAGAAGDWHKYLKASTSGSSGNSYSMDSGKGSDDTYSGPFKSDESILKLKGNVTALNAKKNEIEHSMEHVKKYVPEQDRTAALGQFKKDLSDIRHMLEEAETTKEHDNEKKGETKGEETNVSSRSTQIWRQKNGGYPQI